MMSGFRSRLANLRCPECGQGNIDYPRTLVTFDKLLYINWPFGFSYSGSGLHCSDCKTPLVCRGMMRVLIGFGIIMICFSWAFSFLPFDPAALVIWITIGWVAFFFVFDPLLARYSLVLEKE